MYQSYFGFREIPFTLLPDPDFLYLSKKHALVLSMLEYSLASDNAGFTVVTGDVGCGKTTLVHRFIKQAGRAYTFGIVNTRPAAGEVLHWVASAFGLEHRNKSQVELYEQLLACAVREYAQGRRLVLIVDEAQCLSSEALEELRMLSNMNRDKYYVLQLILLGQPDLRGVLQRADLEQFAQRVAVFYHLEPMTYNEVVEYIEHRLAHVGGRSDIFDAAALKVIFQHSRGVPRLVNSICDLALVFAMAEDRQTVDAELVRAAIQERGLLHGPASAAADGGRAVTVLNHDRDGAGCA